MRIQKYKDYSNGILFKRIKKLKRAAQTLIACVKTLIACVEHPFIIVIGPDFPQNLYTHP